MPKITPSTCRVVVTLMLLALVPLLPGAAAQSATGSTEVTSGSQSAVVDHTVSWMKKHLALTAAQVEQLVKATAALRTNADALSEPRLADELNKILTESGIGGVEIINRHDPLYWLYRERFGLSGPDVPPQLPAWLTRRGSHWYVWLAIGTLGEKDGHPLTRGDEVIFDAGEPLTFSSDDRRNNTGSAPVQIRSLAHATAVRKNVPLVLKSTSQLLTDIVQTNARQIQLTGSGNKTAGYLPMPTADLPMLRAACTKLLTGFEQTTDALIVDLRGPFGAGGLSGIELFLSEKGERLNFKKRLYILTDRHTAGGREVLAAMLQRHAGAVLIGETTAGISAPVEVADLDQRRYLLVATREEKAGFGPLKPEHPVPDTLVYAAGRDDILNKALAVAAADLR